MKICPWCKGGDDFDPAPASLCLTHLAEYEGLSVYQLDTMAREQYAEWMDTLG